MATSTPINPVNLPAERAVLGAIVERCSLLSPVISSGLRAEHFSLSDHRRVFDAIQRLAEREAPIDLVAVAEELGNTQQDFVLLSDLLHGVVLNERHVIHYVAIIRKKSRLRSLLKISQWIAENVNDTADPNAIITHVNNMLQGCSEGHVR